jgi:hypothetical protein
MGGATTNIVTIRDFGQRTTGLVIHRRLSIADEVVFERIATMLELEEYAAGAELLKKSAMANGQHAIEFFTGRLAAGSADVSVVGSKDHSTNECHFDLEWRLILPRGVFDRVQRLGRTCRSSRAIALVEMCPDPPRSVRGFTGRRAR